MFSLYCKSDWLCLSHKTIKISAFHGDLNYVVKGTKTPSSSCDFQRFSIKGINPHFPIHCRRKRSSKHEGAGGSGGGSSSMGLGHVEAFWDCPGVATNSNIFCFLSVKKSQWPGNAILSGSLQATPLSRSCKLEVRLFELTRLALASRALNLTSSLASGNLHIQVHRKVCYAMRVGPARTVPKKHTQNLIMC